MTHSAAATTPDNHYHRAWVGWLSLAQLIGWGSLFYTFGVILGPVEHDLQLTRAESSLAFSLALLTEGLLAYPVGRWIDRGHERIVMTAGSALAALGLFAHGWVHSVAGYYAVWVLLGAAMSATLYPPVFAVVTRRFPHDFRRAIITMTFLGGLASTVFIPLTSVLVETVGWRYALWCLAALQAVVCVPLHWRVLRHAPPALQTQSAHVSGNHSVKSHVLSLPFLLVGVFVVLMMSITVALPAHMVSLLREHDLNEVWVVAIPASIGAVQVLGRVLLYLGERHLDPHLANRLIPCLLPLALATLLLAPKGGQGHIVWLLLFVGLWGMAIGLLTIVKGTAIAEYVNRDHVAALNGALGLPLALARAAAPLGLGLLWNSQVGYAYGLWVLFGLSLVGIAALMGAQKVAYKRRCYTIDS